MSDSVVPVDAPTAEPSVLAAADSRVYWDQRHARVDALRSGGNVAMDVATNAMLYALRVARLIEAMEAASDSVVPLRVLDAGCGKGHFTRAMATFGHRVDGIDTSAVAVAECRRQAVGGDTYEVCALSDWRPPHLYDCVFSVDVLFHIMSDDEWEASVRNLASLVRVGGRLLLADHDSAADRVWSNYQKTRSTARYRDLLTELGFRYGRFVPNDFRGDPVGLHLATRLA
jgi:2-polyprenyl-3-methyl-5-hydroxy-6-metoxy-1,4-benzoquinol methylase